LADAVLNPLLDFSGLPRFAAIQPAHIAPAVDALLAAARAVKERTVAAPATWDGFVAPMEDANERLGRAWGQIEHLHAVLDSPALRESYNANLPKVTQYWTELGQDTLRFEKYKALAASPGFALLSATRKRLVELRIKDFRLSGAELPAQLKPRYAAIQDELASLSAKFSENLLWRLRHFRHQRDLGETGVAEQLRVFLAQLQQACDQRRVVPFRLAELGGARRVRAVQRFAQRAVIRVLHHGQIGRHLQRELPAALAVALRSLASRGEHVLRHP